MATKRSMNSGLAESISENSSTTTNRLGSGVEVGAAEARLLVVAQRGEVAGLAQQLLAAHHLTGQGVLHAVDQGELVLQVGDDRRHVRQVGEAGEGRAALEVDEDHVEDLAGVRHGQAEDQRAQELRLAGAGRADHQAVRSHALLGGLLDVEVDRRTGVADADRAPAAGRAPGAAARRPRGRRSGRRTAPSRSISSGVPDRESSRTGPLARRAAGRAGGRRPRRWPGRPGRRWRARRPRAPAARSGPPGRPGQQLGLEVQPQPGRSSSSSQRSGRSSTVRPWAPSSGTRWLPGGRPRRRPRRSTCGVTPRWSPPKRGRSARSAGSICTRSSAESLTIRLAPDGVALAGAVGVRQPLEPLPLLRRASARWRARR